MIQQTEDVQQYYFPINIVMHLFACFIISIIKCIMAYCDEVDTRLRAFVAGGCGVSG